MIKWAQGLPRETIVLVQGVVQKPVEPIKSTSIRDAEIKIYKVCQKNHNDKYLPSDRPLDARHLPSNGGTAIQP
jgi:aspartyl-tRNA synthetase